MKKIDPKANRDLVHAKINSLRTSYRRELEKVKSSQKSSAEADDMYEPSLWYYYEMDFLRDQETLKRIFISNSCTYFKFCY